MNINDLMNIVSKLDDSRHEIINSINSKGLSIPNDTKLINVSKYVASPHIELTFNLSNPGITLIVPGSSDGYVLINWGDGTQIVDTSAILLTEDDLEVRTNITNSQLINDINVQSSHLYSDSGSHIIKLTGEIESKYLIGRSFSGNSNLTELVLRNVALSTAEFKNCSSLDKVSIFKNSGPVPSKCFDGCPLKDIEFHWSSPSDVVIEDSAFNGVGGTVLIPQGSLSNFINSDGSLTQDARNYPDPAIYQYKDLL
jgi:hypothetical protein